VVLNCCERARALDLCTVAGLSANAWPRTDETGGSATEIFVVEKC